MTTMTDTEYIKAEGACCPLCRSSNISTCGPFDGEGGSQDVTCFDCGKIWRDNYKLIGYDVVG